jgi:hypothetical protein
MTALNIIRCKKLTCNQITRLFQFLHKISVSHLANVRRKQVTEPRLQYIVDRTETRRGLIACSFSFGRKIVICLGVVDVSGSVKCIWTEPPDYGIGGIIVIVRGEVCCCAIDHGFRRKKQGLTIVMQK